MATFDIYSGENLLIEVPLFELATGLTWKGRYDAATAYVVDDALLGDDNIGYRVTAPTTGNPPPNVAFYTELPLVQTETVAGIVMQLVQGGKNIVQWQYRARLAKLTSGSLIVGQKYLIHDFNASDDFTNVGAGSNAAGVIFTATGTTPTTWTNSSVLYQIELPSNFAIEDGLFKAELLAADTTPLSGEFELRINISFDDSIYIGSGAQTDVLCIEAAIQITPC
jgi:hypothetical protein